MGTTIRDIIQFAIPHVEMRMQDWPEDEWVGDDDIDLNFWMDGSARCIDVYDVNIMQTNTQWSLRMFHGSWQEMEMWVKQIKYSMKVR